MLQNKGEKEQMKDFLQNIRAVFFDLDDTLYDQLEPFRAAVADTMSPETAAELELGTLFRRVRHYSDRLWDSYKEGKLSLEDVRMQRLILAFGELGIEMSKETAAAIQSRYLQGQQQIMLSSGAEELIAALRQRGLDVGILTNGPVDHQMVKIRALKLDRLVPKDRIFISDAVGIAKPDPRVFEHISRVTGHLPEHCLYIGDAWENDVITSLEAGWRAIWLSRRGFRPDTGHQPAMIISDLRELLDLIVLSNHEVSPK
ncbi:HAD family hydrolase [Paenibacillus sp. sptzw28]|uniref:HAD family hydrolase n=1 Tax=Paenibacillus sp. sptzw28 TaxID=715179 RepID=UPI001C6E7484|nr:HAD family hydrolase [Paenibacillus sp. sptzw28]QYR21239.1 HAD family hydrolase [Paenibacillus sp. sptzw28]